jgi:hypothetical protein
LLNHLNNFDLDQRVVKSLVEQIVGHFDELSLKCQVVIESVVEELNMPSDTMAVIDAFGEREASMQYADWERKMSHESSSPSIASGENCSNNVQAAGLGVEHEDTVVTNDKEDESFLPQELKARESSNNQVAGESI